MKKDIRIGIVAAEFNPSVVDKLLASAHKTLLDKGITESNITTLRVPGAFELPLVAQQLTDHHDAVIALGVVIRGETAHFDYVSSACAHGVMQAGLNTDVPVIFGVLTTDTVEQAMARAGGKSDKGVDAAQAALDMINIMQACSESEPKDE